MVLTSLDGLSNAQKEDLVASLCCLVIGDECDADKITAVATASGNKLGPTLAGLFSGVVSMAPKKLETFTPGPGGGGGGGGGDGADAGDAAAAAEEEEEEEEAEVGGGDIFGAGDGGGGEY